MSARPWGLILCHLQKEKSNALLGREAVVEKRMARREDAHARDASPDIAAIPGGGDMYGGGDDSFAAARNRQGVIFPVCSFPSKAPDVNITFTGTSTFTTSRTASSAKRSAAHRCFLHSPQL